MLLRCLQNYLLVAGLAGAGGTGCFVTDPALVPPHPIAIALGETVKAFMEANHIAAGPRRTAADLTVDLDLTRDTDPIVFADRWLSLTYMDGEQGFSLPPGRALFIGQTAGRITNFEFTPFAQPKPLEETTAFASHLFDSLQAQGWSGEVAVFLPKSAGDFDGRTKTAMVAQLHGQGGHDVELIERQAGTAAAGRRVLTLAALGEPSERQSGYVLDIRFSELAANAPSPGDMLLPRRIQADGRADHPLPLRAWVQQPDWMPTSAGMVPTPADEARKDGSNWVMPAPLPLKK